MSHMKSRCMNVNEKHGRKMPMVITTAPAMPPATNPSHVMNITSGVGTTLTMAMPSRNCPSVSCLPTT